MLTSQCHCKSTKMGPLLPLGRQYPIKNSKKPMHYFWCNHKNRHTQPNELKNITSWWRLMFKQGFCYIRRRCMNGLKLTHMKTIRPLQ